MTYHMTQSLKPLSSMTLLPCVLIMTLIGTVIARLKMLVAADVTRCMMAGSALFFFIFFVIY
jgi:ATP/ADP translocase